MRRINLRTGTALALILPVLMAPAFMTNAAAQVKKDPRAAAPAARAAPVAAVQHAPPAPPPHMAAPVAATPHFTAPVAHVAAPVQQPHIQQQQHFAAPTHVAAPVHAQTPHIATQQSNRPNFAHSERAHANANASANVKQQQIQAHSNNAGQKNLKNLGNNAGEKNLKNLGNNAGEKNLAHGGNPTTTHANTPNPSNAARAVTGPNKTVPNAASKMVTPNNANPNKFEGGNAEQQAAAERRKPGRARAGPAEIAAASLGTNRRRRRRSSRRKRRRARRSMPAMVGPSCTIRPSPTPRSATRLRAPWRALPSRAASRSFTAATGTTGSRTGAEFHGIVIGWGGPVFWPYAYADLVDYTFWPSANDTFWPYAYDDVYDGIFGAYAPDASAYANVRGAAGGRARGRIATGRVATGAAAGGMAQICSGQASGLTDWPIERIAQQVQPTDQQRSLLDQLKDATANAVNMLQSACPTDLPSTPTGRLAAMRQRIEPMLQAVQTGAAGARNVLRFAQRRAEGALHRSRIRRRPEVRPAEQPNVTQACGGSAKQIASLPINQIQQLLHPNDAQRAALDALNNASAQAAAVLNESCAPDQSLTPPGRVAAMETRLSAMLKALDTVQPAIAKFYNSLSDEQKARFDRLGPRQG